MTTVPLAALTRREKLLCAIWDAWKEGRSIRFIDLMDVAGYISPGSVRMAILVRQGWLRRSETGKAGLQHKYLPGPRFGGVDRKTGRPLYIIGEWE